MGRLSLFGSSRSRSVEYNIVRGNGWRLLRDKIDEAIHEDGFLFVLIIGERGKGKSTLALNVLNWIYGGDAGRVKRATIFTIDDYDSIVNKQDNLLSGGDGRIKALLWDDMGLHFSTYQWFIPHLRQRMTEFIENFQSVREDIAVLIGTVVEADMLPPKMRGTANYMVDCVRRGKAKLFGYKRYLWFKTWKVKGELEWTKADPNLYSYYKKMKKKAHRAKEKARIASRTKLAKIYADLLKSLSRVDVELLYGLGIVDKDNELTPFGEYVLAKAGLVLEDLLVGGVV
ncbi:MAG: hypothetical protein F7C38_06845 [Desulfurococcales archaeon]|nr:hypothetical protein [Desulfurococcales archaeon]